MKLQRKINLQKDKKTIKKLRIKINIKNKNKFFV